MAVRVFWAKIGGLLVPVGVVADDGDAAGLELLLDAVLAGVAGLVADGAAEDQRLALAAEDLAQVVTGQAGGRQVVGLDQAGDVVVLDGGVDGDDRDAGGLGLGQGVVPAAGVGGADDEADRPSG